MQVIVDVRAGLIYTTVHGDCQWLDDVGYCEIGVDKFNKKCDIYNQSSISAHTKIV
jgi:hypothetical protein